MTIDFLLLPGTVLGTREKITLFSYNILFRSRKHVVVVNWLSKKKAKVRKTGREIERREGDREEGGTEGGRGRKERREEGRRKSLICCVSSFPLGEYSKPGEFQTRCCHHLELESNVHAA